MKKGKLELVRELLSLAPFGEDLLDPDDEASSEFAAGEEIASYDADEEIEVARMDGNEDETGQGKRKFSAGASPARGPLPTRILLIILSFWS